MGWLEGVLTGYADRHFAIQKEKRAEAEAAARREEQVLTSLLSSEDPEIKDLAAAGVLDLGNPRRRSGGLAGWMGEMDKSPYLPMIQRARARIESDWEADNAAAELGQGAAPPTPSIPTPAGSVPATGSAALPSTSQVTGTPGTPPTPAPPPPPQLPGLAPGTPVPGRSVQLAEPPPEPPRRNVFAFGGAPAGPYRPPPGGPEAPVPAGPYRPPPGGPEAPVPIGPYRSSPEQAGAAPGGPQDQVRPPMSDEQAGTIGPPQPPAGPPVMIAPPGPPPQPPGQVNVGGPGATTQAVGRMAPVRSPRTELPSIFPTAADLQRQQSRATVQGKLDAYTEMYRAQNFSDQESAQKAAELLEHDLLGAGAGNPYMSIRGEYTDPATGRVIRTPVTFDKSAGGGGRYLLPNGQPAPPDLRLVTAGRLRASVEEIAQKMGYPSATAVPQHLWPAMEAAADALEARTVANRTDARLDATAMGTLSPQDAIAMGVPLGTQGRQITNQRLPTPLDLQRRRSLLALQTEVERIQPLVEAALVSEQNLSGMFPNAANAARARTTHRNQFAALDQAVQSIVNTLARAIADQKGAQTEQDAKRAEAALASFTGGLKNMFTDPLGGDTIESANIRLAGTLATIKMIIAQTPGVPKVDPLPDAGGGAAGGGAGGAAGGAAAADAASTAGASGFVPKAKGFDRDPATGKRYLDGKEY